MSYNDLIQKEGIQSQYLCVLNPSRSVTSWTNVSGNVYYNLFDYGYVNGVDVDGVALTLDTSSSPSSNKFYYDHQVQKVYINVASPSTKYITVYYELYMCTLDTHWHRNPLDIASQSVFYDGYIIQPPSLRYSLSEQLLGYIPSQSTTMGIINAEHFIEKHLYDSSFHNKYIYVYHWIGSLKTANIKLIIKGIMGNVRYSDGRVSINIVDRIDLFNQEYRNKTKSFYNTTDFPNINSAYIGKPIRYVFGVMDSVVPVNLSYQTLNPTTSDNRVWSAREGSLNAITRYVGTGSTTTRTYMNSTNGLRALDQVMLVKSVNEYIEITNVTATYIEHTALSSGAALAGDSVIRQTVGYFHIDQGSDTFKVPYNLFTCSVSNGVVIVTLDTTLETALSMSILYGSEACRIRVYGENNWVTMSGSPFGSDSTLYSCLTNPAVILFELIKRSGVAESDINLTSFTALSSSIGSIDIGFSQPISSYSDFQTYKDIIIKIMQSTLTRLFINGESKWEVKLLAPLGTAITSIASDEIVLNSIDYDITNIDTLSDVIVGYGYKETDSVYNSKSAQSLTAKYLHKISKQKTFNTYLINSSDAVTLANRLSYIYGDRYGELSFNCKNRFFNNSITDTINVELYKLLGYDYNSSILRNRDFDLTEIVKGLRSVNFKLNDCKGIEDNSGSW